MYWWKAQVVKAVRSIDDDAGFLRVRIGSIILNRCALISIDLSLLLSLFLSVCLYFTLLSLPFALLFSFHLLRRLCSNYIADKVVAFIGKGTFANVYHCDDRVAKRPVALKVVRNVEKYNQAARTEIETLERLRQADPGNSKYVSFSFQAG